MNALSHSSNLEQDLDWSFPSDSPTKSLQLESQCNIKAWLIDYRVQGFFWPLVTDVTKRLFISGSIYRSCLPTRKWQGLCLSRPGKAVLESGLLKGL